MSDLRGKYAIIGAGNSPLGKVPAPDCTRPLFPVPLGLPATASPTRDVGMSAGRSYRVSNELVS